MAIAAFAPALISGATSLIGGKMAADGNNKAARLQMIQNAIAQQKRIEALQEQKGVLTGAQDQGAPPDVVRAMAQKAPGARYVELPDAGHISVMEQPALFAEALTGFIGPLVAARAA